VEVSVLRDQAEALVQYTVPAEGTVTRAITEEARAAPTITSFDRDWVDQGRRRTAPPFCM